MFDAEGFECGGDGTKLGAGGGNRLVLVGAETVSGWFCSTVVGSVGVWKVTGPVP